MEPVLFYIVATLAISIVINIVLKKIGISQIIGYIAAGIIASYLFGLKGYANSHTLKLAGEFGIVFLMFTVGLEISLAKMRTMKKVIFVNGISQVSITTLIGYLVSRYVFSIGTIPSVVIALAFSLSSTAVVLNYLKASKDIYTPYGQHSTGILIFQDIAVIPILILIGFLNHQHSTDVLHVLIFTTESIVIVLAILFIVGKTVITQLLRFSISSELEELFIGSVLVIVMGASLLAHYMGFTYSLGAFIVGMLISETKYYRKIESDIAPFKNLLLGTFFVVVGMKIDVSLFLKDIWLIVGLFILTYIVKAVIIYFIIYKNKETSIKTALAISQVGEFSFVIFALASSGGILPFHMAQILTLVVVLSMIVTPFIISNIDIITTVLFKQDNSTTSLQEINGHKNHIIVCGYSFVGKYVVKELEKINADYVIVDNNINHVQRGLADGREIYLGDMSKENIIDALHVKDAAGVIVTLENMDKTYLICEAVHGVAPDVNLIVKIMSAKDREKLRPLHLSNIVDGKKEVAKELVKRMRKCSIESVCENT